jgi:integrase
VTTAAVLDQSGAPGDDQDIAELWAAIDQDFLALLSWDHEQKVLIFPQEHVQLGWMKCRVDGCRKDGRSATGLCPACTDRWRRGGAGDVDAFLRLAKRDQRCVGVELCAVRGCARPWKTGRKQVCNAHDYQQREMLRLPLDLFLNHPDVVPFAAFGRCSVVACTRDRPGRGPHCHAHQQRLATELRRSPDIDVEHWQRTTPAVAQTSEVSLRGLHPRVVAEVIYGLQERTRGGSKTHYWQVRPFCDLLRAGQVSSVVALPSSGLNHANRGLRTIITTAVRRRGMTPETERHGDVWDLVAFGHRGTLTFAEISQPWLREATKRWAYDDLPRRRGDAVSAGAQDKVTAIAKLSQSLRLQRDDRGDLPSRLGRLDITAFCNRLAHLADTEEISARRRHTHVRQARLVLTRMKKLGLTLPGEPLHGLPDDFAIREEDVPDEPEDLEAGKDLPIEVMRHLCQHLPTLSQTGAIEIGVAVELMIDTGRRPEEICKLKLDCLDRDGDAKPVLIYDNFKANRPGRRLPITEETAEAIRTQQQRVRDRFPNEPINQLGLLPAAARNPHGRSSISDGWVSKRHRDWVSSLPDIVVPTVVHIDGKATTTMLPFDKQRIFPYAYRHSYAQRHADAGVDPDALRELMDHRLLSTTQRYYRNPQKLHQTGENLQVAC